MKKFMFFTMQQGQTALIWIYYNVKNYRNSF